METKDSLEKQYQTPDPWGFSVHPDDAHRKQVILDQLAVIKPAGFHRALDIGAGEGWITKDLPAWELHAYELSDTAKGRLPVNVTGVSAPQGQYDLIIATGVLYRHYDPPTFFKLMREHASSVILTCNIEAWEHPEVEACENELAFLKGKQIHMTMFPYREYTQKLRVFKI